LVDPRLVAPRLARAGCIAADEEAREMVAAAPGGEVPEDWIARRERGEPLAWITGRTRFCGLWLHVDRGVYVPRLQTEDLARRASALLPAGGRALDLCTGCGAVAAHLVDAVPSATVLAVDREPHAVECARRNGVDAVVGDIDEAAADGGPFDLITAVPPYVPTPELRTLAADVRRWEPRPALDGGPDGLDTARRIVRTAARLLKPHGWLVIELGGSQDELLQPELDANGFDGVDGWYDAEGDLRGLAATSSSSAAARA
jgi:release factor glutamine methyltransferase